MRFLSRALIGAAVGLLFFSSVGLAQSESKSKTHIKFSTWHPPASKDVQTVFTPMLEELRKRSGGRITYTLLAGGALGAGPAHYDIVKNGLSDMGYFTATWTPGRFPLSDVLSLGASIEGKDIATDIGNALYKRALSSEFPGVHMIQLNGCIQSYIWTKKPLEKSEDIRGLRIGCPGGMRCDYVKATGASIVFMPGTDFYLSLQTGTVDGVITCPPIFQAFRLQEVAKNGLIIPLGCVTEGIIMNADSWKKVPDDLKPLIEEVCSNPFRTTGGLNSATYGKMMKEISDAGVKVTYVEKSDPKDAERWFEKFQQATREWVQNLEAKGLPAKQTVKAYYEETSKRGINAQSIPTEWQSEWKAK